MFAEPWFGEKKNPKPLSIEALGMIQKLVVDSWTVLDLLDYCYVN